MSQIVYSHLGFVAKIKAHHEMSPGGHKSDAYSRGDLYQDVLGTVKDRGFPYIL